MKAGAACGGNTATTLPRSHRNADPMAAYDRLPAELRAWLSQALLPWSAHSARRLWDRMLRDCGGDPGRAQARLTQIERRRITQDARRIWGADHPAAQTPLRTGSAVDRAENPRPAAASARRD